MSRVPMTIRCEDCGQRGGLDSDELVAIREVQAFIAAHNLCTLDLAIEIAIPAQAGPHSRAGDRVTAPLSAS